MTAMAASASQTLLARWSQLSGSAVGRWLFSRGIGLAAPYSGTIRPVFERLEPGRVVVTLRDRRRVRNHLRSIHAAALLNLVELCGGVATLASIPADARMIITGVSADFVKKARGRLTAVGACEVLDSNERTEARVEVSITDDAGDVVATGEVRTLVGPIA
jgi:acyl-coenzyme A thioesterase PaaI-like protein